ncbi:MAG: Gfo/Idh/MocA family oxidoreductase [Rubinisphaera brasiliensis]|uniref:Gfo/Idh/MocA family oxidoreductase n=1 Tax=Rubinisphaera TaxID=1649490 RepID=UPI001F017D83|nr:Gfo/Idh/MocA family oxidoreductase [Rubinisphaera sp. JC750]
MPQPSASRRQFLQTSAATTVVGTLASQLTSPAAFAGETNTLKVGLVGCGGRGTGAARDTLSADPNCKITAIGDLFPEYTESTINRLKSTEYGDRVTIEPDHVFSGFDAYKKVIDSGVDVVLLATPPGFRPQHVEAAINAGKHVFCEKPVAVDPVGCRTVWEAGEKARQKGLTLVSGLCWRYEDGMKETIDRIHNGAVGELKALYSTRYNAGAGKHYARTPGMSDMEWQIRNWYFFTWLSADFFAEQFVHELDKMAWVMQNEYPERVLATGGRQTRIGEANGDVFDHFAAMFEYKNGLRYHATTRHQVGCTNEFQDFVVGDKGTADLMKYNIQGENEWRKRKNVNRMYHNEHVAMYDSIRNSKALNNTDYMVKSSLMGIMARMSAYTGKEVTWDQAWNSQLDTFPKEQSFEAAAPPVEVAVPGVTPLV